MGSRGGSPPPQNVGAGGERDMPRINVLSAEDATRAGDQPLRIGERVSVNPSD